MKIILQANTPMFKLIDYMWSYMRIVNSKYLIHLAMEIIIFKRQYVFIFKLCENNMVLLLAKGIIDDICLVSKMQLFS